MKKLTVFTLFFLFAVFARADTFVVTSNADSGQGTLREAITMATLNGTSVQDQIIFAFTDTSRTARTITLLTELPSLTSNLVIDGATQSGASIGKSDARIILYVASPALQGFTFLKIANAENVAVYGLFFLNGYFSLFTTGTSGISGIEMRKVKQVTIGGPGKGNYFRGLKRAIYTQMEQDEADVKLGSDIVIQSNVLGNDELGNPTLNYGPYSWVNPVEYGLWFQNCSNITIGGPNAGEQNTITAYESQFQSYLPSGNGHLRIEKNNFGIRTDGTLPEPGTAIDGKIMVVGAYLGNYNAFSDYALEIKENVISGRLQIHGLTKLFLIHGNRIIHDNNFRHGYHEPKMMITHCSGGGLIGGLTSKEINEFYDLVCRQGSFGYQSLTQGSIIVSFSPKVTIQRNMMRSNHQYGSSLEVSYSGEPVVRIDSLAENLVKGKATPNSKIEVFLDDQCMACDGEVFLGETHAASDSTWSFSGTFKGTVIATATKDSTTSSYTAPLIHAENYTVRHPTCGQNNGEIIGIKARGSWTSTEWRQIIFENGIFRDTLFSTSLDLLNAPAGDFYFIAKLGKTCQSAAIHFKLRNYTPMIDTAMSSSIQPACGLANGSISGLRIIDGEYAETKWVNDQGHLFEGGTNGTYSWLNDLPAGRYRLIVTDQRSGCADTSRYYLLQNQSGPSFQDGSVQITPATCGSQTGSITGITVSNTSGEPHLWWLDSTGKVVGNTFNLQRVPPGKYRLKYKDAHPCDTIITPYYVVGNTGAIAIDTAGKIISPAKCSGGGGSIRGIKVSGGSNFQWKNTVTNAVVATSLNVFDLPAGSYQLTVTNQQGCIQTSPVITIPQAAFIPIQILSSRTVPASCGQPNGFVEINVFSRDTGLYAFQWVDSASGQVISRFTNLYQINNGHYELFARDSNGCEQEILDVLMFGTPIPNFDYTRMNITPDRCLTGAGAIEGIVVRNLASGPTVYAWVNSSGDTVGRTLNIRNLPQGSYRLRVNNGGCNVESQPVAVGNVNATLPAPQYDEQTILKNTSATLTVKNTQSGTYQLFNNPAGTTPMQLNTTGIFTTPPLTADQQFYVRFVNGVCSSALASVWIKVVDKNAVYVPTVFSPNADGKNDVLKAIPVGRVKLVQFVVYNRWGEVVFSTTNFSKGWNGTHLGVPAETGVYVWMLRAVDELKGAPIEQKGTVMIIR